MQSVHTSYVMSVIAPIHALSIPSIDPYNDKHQEFPAKFPGTSLGEKKPSKITTKIPDNVTLTLQQVKFTEKKFPGTNLGEKNPSQITTKIPDNVTLTLQQVKFTEETPSNFPVT